MTLIKSISGIRGTIGGKPGESLSPQDIFMFTAAYAQWLTGRKAPPKVVIGRDARISGLMVRNLVAGTLQSMGISVIDLGLSTTPTVAVMVPAKQAGGGIVITASHNPEGWNALKLLNEKGEFISASDGREITAHSHHPAIFQKEPKTGGLETDDSGLDTHILQILKLPLVDTAAIRRSDFTVVVDGINSTGGIAVPMLLKAMGVNSIIEFHCRPTGKFYRNPEPLPEHLNAVSLEVKKHKADLGIVVDPDVDRLAFICEDGTPFGEEYTLVAVADYVLRQKKGNTVSNLSSTRALKEITEKAGGKYFASGVGEVNVVETMKNHKAVIGGEGNGGVIYPGLHYGRDALAGIALFLTHLALSKKPISALRGGYPDYFISKNKLELNPATDLGGLLESLGAKYSKYDLDKTDGLRIDFGSEWVHLRPSNTEPILRIFAESSSETTAEALSRKFIGDIGQYLKGKK